MTRRLVRFALRTLAMNRGVASVAVLTLALGIGANTALFTVADVLFLRPPAGIASPDRLVSLGRTSSSDRWAGFGHLQFQRYRDAARSFAGLAAAEQATALLRTAGATAVPVRVTLVTGGYFAVLGVRIARGRDFLPEEERVAGAAPVVILSDALWRSRFAGDASVVGRTVTLGATGFTVVGIAPRGFRGLEVDGSADLWMPLAMEGATTARFPVLNSDFFSSLRPVGRLAPGIDLAAAQAELDVLAARIERPQGPRGETMRVRLSPNVTFPDPGWRTEVANLLVPLEGAALLVLLVVCANLGGLLLARSEARRRTIAVRLALGAGRGRLVRELVAENLLLVVPGWLGGLLVSRWLIALIAATAAPNLTFAMDSRAAVFALALAVASAMLASVAPTLRIPAAAAVRDLQQSRMSGSRPTPLRVGLVTAQVAMTLVLCVGTGLMVRTLWKAASVDVGFDATRVMVATPDLELAGYDEPAAAAFYPRLAGSLAALPGVQAVSWAAAEPVDPGFLHGLEQIVLDDASHVSQRERLAVDHNEVGPGYFAVLGLRAVRGRVLEASDDGAAPLVAVVNQAMARRYWPAGDPLGSRLRVELFMDWSPPIQIVGVVPDVRTVSLEAEVRPAVYVPLAQSAGRRQHTERNQVVLIRTGPGFAGPDGVARTFRALDPDLPPVVAETVVSRIAQRLPDQRLAAEVLGLFGGLALLIAAVGLYGVLAFDVAARTREIGIRVALGAVRGDVLRLLMRRGLTIAAAGTIVGLLGSLALTRVLASELYGISPRDPVSFGVAALVLGGAALLATWVPARRATRFDPVSALRTE